MKSRIQSSASNSPYAMSTPTATFMKKHGEGISNDIARLRGTRFVTSAVQACRNQAVARAVHQIGSPALAALHAGSTKNG